MRNKTLIAAGIGLLAFIGVAISQTISVPQVTLLNSTDLIQVIVRGVPSAQSQYATPSLITSQFGYQKAIPVSFAGNAYTFAANQGYLVLAPTTTIAQLSITLAAAPSDGARECIFTTNTITNFQPQASAGQTLNAAVTTLAVNTGVCYLYSASNTTWDRS